MMASSLPCPLCLSSVPLDTLICHRCGSLEGILPNPSPLSSLSLPSSLSPLSSLPPSPSVQMAMCKAPQSRMFSYEWSKGFVAPHVGSSFSSIQSALDNLGVTRGWNVIDLGCGDGRVCIESAKRGARAVGVDLDEGLLQQGRDTYATMVREMGESESVLVGTVEFLHADIFSVDIIPFDAVFLFLLPHTLESLSPKLRDFVLGGGYVCTFAWPLPLLSPLLSSSSLSLPSPSLSADSTALSSWYIYSLSKYTSVPA